MVLIPKGVGGYRGIVLVEVIWKVCISILNNSICSSITLYDALNCFIQRRGSGTATLEAKMAQKLVGMCHDPPFQVLLDVRKA